MCTHVPFILKWNKYHIVETVLKFIDCIVETEQKSMPSENEIHYRSLSCLRTGTSIKKKDKSGGVRLVLQSQPSLPVKWCGHAIIEDKITSTWY
jgi:hypothetical protein